MREKSPSQRALELLSWSNQLVQAKFWANEALNRLQEALRNKPKQREAITLRLKFSVVVRPESD
jgi:hypothetical protein